MVEIVKTSKEPVPQLRFIGKKYGNQDRVDGFFGAKWDEWFENGWFSQLENLGTLDGWGHYIGLMGHNNGEFEYWIGMFMPADTNAPMDFSHMDYPACNLGVCRIKGKADGIYGNEPMCCDKLQKEGFEMLEREFICFERELDCNHPDATNIEEDEAILDICFFVK